MSQLIDVFGFLAVLLRGATLSFEALAVGGVIFLLWVARADSAVVARRTRVWIAIAGIGLSITALVSVAVSTAILIGTAGVSLTDAAAANFFLAGCAIAVSAAALAFLAGGRQFWPMLVPAAVILAASVMTSHSLARMEHRVVLASLTALHHLTTASWVGGLPFLLIGLRVAPDSETVRRISSRFSRNAMVSSAALALAGVGLSIAYIGSPRALYGTAYGVMVIAKILLFGMLGVLGVLNFFIVGQLRAGAAPLLTRLRRFGEAEIGIGFCVIFAAASLTSQPPAIDMAPNRVTASEIAARMSPKWPRLETPALNQLSQPTNLIPQTSSGDLGSYLPGQQPDKRNPDDIAWSEYNHHWAGLVVLSMGLLAMLARKWAWARVWPLLFLGLALFLLLRADADAWPLGPIGFWESFRVAEVAQHRLAVLLIIAFACFEFGVQTGRLPSRSAALIFPAVCALGGALLLTHSHSLTNVKEELLAEISHIPLALFGVAAGWTRWLELRLPSSDRRIPAMLWPICFVCVGAVLLLYREA